MISRAQTRRVKRSAAFLRTLSIVATYGVWKRDRDDALQERNSKIDTVVGGSSRPAPPRLFCFVHVCPFLTARSPGAAIASRSKATATRRWPRRSRQETPRRLEFRMGFIGIDVEALSEYSDLRWLNRDSQRSVSGCPRDTIARPNRTRSGRERARKKPAQIDRPNRTLSRARASLTLRVSVFSSFFLSFFREVFPGRSRRRRSMRAGMRIRAVVC